MTDDERRQMEGRIAVGCEGFEWWTYPTVNDSELFHFSYLVKDRLSDVLVKGKSGRITDLSFRQVPDYTTDLNATVRAADSLRDKIWSEIQDQPGAEVEYYLRRPHYPPKLEVPRFSALFLFGTNKYEWRLSRSADTPALALCLALDAALGALGEKE